MGNKFCRLNKKSKTKIFTRHLNWWISEYDHMDTQIRTWHCIYSLMFKFVVLLTHETYRKLMHYEY